MPSRGVIIGIIIAVIVVGLALGLGLGFGLKDDKASGSAATPAAAAGSTTTPATTTPATTTPATTTPVAPPAPAAHTGTGTTSQSFGGGGGGDYTMNCPSGKIVKNISGRGGWWVDQLNGKCDDGTALTPVGGQGGGPVNTTDCPTGYTGVDVTYGQFVGKVTPKCAGAPISTPIGGGLGSGSGQSGSFNCPTGQVITGLSGKAGGYVDSMKVTCK
jgi:hypothetical protein